ncbi:MAG: PIN domain-containing protein [Dehalococcoidia bacterium]|nr:PIN domain-containing protein [Dehalococcoidia bacterium]
MPEITAIASITVSELEVGIRLADSTARRSQREVFLAEVLESFHVLPLTIEEAREHARVRVGLRRQGLSIGYADAIIAATALANGHDVLTYNVGEFRRAPGLACADGG